MALNPTEVNPKSVLHALDIIPGDHSVCVCVYVWPA